MAARLSSEEEQATKQFLEELDQRPPNANSNNDPVAWDTAVKFLMARKFDVKRALDLYASHENVRAKEGIIHVDPTEDSVRRELLTEKFTVLSGRDNHGAAIALFTARLHFPRSTTHQATLKSLVFQLDTALKSVETQRNGLVFIYDMSASKYGHFDYELSIKILSLLKGSYPARLKKVLIVTAPLWFRAPFKILRLFVKEKLRDRVHTVSQGQLHMHIPVNSLPERFGGKMEVRHKEWVADCLRSMWGKGIDVDSDIVAYFERVDNHMLPELSISSISSLGSMTTSAVGEDSVFGGSDMDSESSHGTVQEKHNSEYREKGSRGDSAMDTSPTTPTAPVSLGQTVPCKRAASSDSSPTGVAPGDPNPPPLPRKKRPAMAKDVEFKPSLHMPEQSGYNIKDFVEYTRIKGRKGLYREYAHIKSEPPVGTFESSKSKPNLPKNRYTDVLCLDESRVKLSCEDTDANSDYINANFVDGYRQKGAYISTQGPLPRTFGDFWRMVWEQMVLLVVMTTRTVERSRLKCGLYWPAEDQSMDEYGDFIVLNNGIDAQTDYTVSSLILQNTKTGESRNITHFQFTGWPDYGVPHSAEAFLDFMFHVRDTQSQRLKELGDSWQGHEGGPPIVIHCSAGIGRTGTFITVDISTRRLTDIGSVDIYRTVQRIRSQRAFSIQMPDQYVFCHLALIQHAERVGLLTEVDMNGFEDSSSESD